MTFETAAIIVTFIAFVIVLKALLPRPMSAREIQRELTALYGPGGALAERRVTDYLGQATKCEFCGQVVPIPSKGQGMLSCGCGMLSVNEPLYVGTRRSHQRHRQ